jgi:LPS export ABC transporter protein LptC
MRTRLVGLPPSRPLALLVACAVLAVTSACDKAGSDRGRVQQVSDSADQLMVGVRTNLTASGVRTAYLEADTAFVYENAGHTELKHIKVTFYTATGVETSHLTGDEGSYRFRTGEMEARGNVLVIRNDGARLMTSLLRYDQAKNEVSTDQPYTTDRGDQHGAGVGFTSDPTFTNITTNRLKGTGGGFTLPGQ